MTTIPNPQAETEAPALSPTERRARIGTPEQYDNLAALARVVRDASNEARTLAMTLGELGTANEAESTRTAWTQIAAVSKVRADEARLAKGELRVRMPNARDLIHDAIESWRVSQTTVEHTADEMRVQNERDARMAREQEIIDRGAGAGWDAAAIVTALSDGGAR